MKLVAKNQIPTERRTRLSNSLWLLVLRLLTMACFLWPAMAQSQTIPKSDTACSLDIETLMTRMLKDLPSYGNRVTQRARRSDRSVEVYNYILVA